MQGVPRFAEATVRVVEEKHAGWRTPATGRDWVSSFERYAFPRIGKMPVWEDTSGFFSIAGGDFLLAAISALLIPRRSKKSEGSIAKWMKAGGDFLLAAISALLIPRRSKKSDSERISLC